MIPTPSLLAAAFGLLLLAGGPAAAQTKPAEPAGSGEDEVKTLKERLSDKASDEQRLDNCQVPADKRGAKPRPGCAPSSDRTR